MAKGISIHVGLNTIDPKHYGTTGDLPYCVNDAKEMRKLAIAEGYQVQDILLNKEATAANILMAFIKASERLEAGDKLLFTYSGHGSYFPDLNGDEDDKYDETWVLYDRMMIDDELYYSLSKFRRGVRIVLISDSCHSGTVAKPLIMSNGGIEFSDKRKLNIPERKVLVEILKSEAEMLYKRHKALYDPHLKFIPSSKDLTIQASVILLAASQDDQLSMGVSRTGRKLSLFTDELITVYMKQKTGMNYKRFVAEIKKRIPAKYRQTPNYFETGIRNEAFLNERPFTI